MPTGMTGNWLPHHEKTTDRELASLLAITAVIIYLFDHDALLNQSPALPDKVAFKRA
jgi:hypothetical protein